DTVVCHRVCSWLRLHRGHDGIHVGNVHHQSDSGWILRIDECPDVGDSEGPEELLTLRGSEPVILVLHVVIGHHSEHQISSCLNGIGCPNHMPCTARGTSRYPS